MKGHLQVFNSRSELAKSAARAIAELLNEAVKERGVARIALAGGDTPRSVYEHLGSDKLQARISWRKTHLFWSDERCVPPDSPQSNFRMVTETLIKRISIPPGNVHRIVGEIPPADAAEIYQEKLKEAFRVSAGDIPVFDVVLLGLGDDGHTASLFPGTSAVNEHDKLVVSLYLETMRGARVTITFPVINKARVVLFLVSGRNKAGILHNVLEGGDVQFPAQMVNPASGQLHWLVDREAASQITSE